MDSLNMHAKRRSPYILLGGFLAWAILTATSQITEERIYYSTHLQEHNIYQESQEGKSRYLLTGEPFWYFKRNKS